MTIEIKMPALSPTMKDGVLSQWFIKAGDKIKPGMVIAEIETDKASMEVESVDSGIVGKILIEDGTQNVAVGSIIALLLENGEDISILDNYKPQDSVNKVVSIDNKVETKKIATVTETKDDHSRLFISPLAKRIAEDKNINLSKIVGTGPNGRIIKHDIENFTDLSSQTSNSNNIVCSSAETKSIPHTQMRRIIAQRLTESKQQAPHFYLNVECQMSNLFDMRKKMNDSFNKQYPNNQINISVNDLIVKASAIALRSNLDINVSWQENEVIMHGNIDISVAVTIPGGLITPIIKNADIIGLLELSKTAKSLIAKAREGKLTPAEFQGGTFSVSNLGMYGIKEFYPIINPPQSAILSIGGTEKKAIVNKNGDVVVDDVCTIGLSVDHRAIDGVAAAKYLQFLKTIIENPLMLSL